MTLAPSPNCEYREVNVSKGKSDTLAAVRPAMCCPSTCPWLCKQLRPGPLRTAAPAPPTAGREGRVNKSKWTYWQQCMQIPGPYWQQCELPLGPLKTAAPSPNCRYRKRRSAKVSGHTGSSASCLQGHLRAHWVHSCPAVAGRQMSSVSWGHAEVHMDEAACSHA